MSITSLHTRLAVLAALLWPAFSQAEPIPPAKLGLCAGCHGARGIASVPGYPHLAGQDLAYLRLALEQYRDGRRENAPMRAALGSVSSADQDLLLQYYAALPRDGGSAANPGSATQ